MKRFSFFLSLIVCMVSTLAAYENFGGKPLGPNVAEYNGEKLQWEEGSHDYFVMFASSLDDTDPANNDNGQNPSADVCLNSSSYTLQGTDIPDDAYVESAFIVWAGTKNLADGTNPAKNTIDLSFEHRDGAISETYTVQTSQAKHTEDKNQDFEFEAIDICSGGDCTLGGRWFTYRTEVTEIFEELHQLGRNEGYDDGYSLLGDYTVSGIECSEDDFYSKNNNGSNSVMVSSWALVIIYRSESVRAKKIYMYRGFELYQMTALDLNVSGFEFPKYPTIRLTLMANEGDPGLAVAQDGFNPAPPEGLQVSGADNENWAPIFNECNPAKHQDSQGSPFEYIEMYNSISSVYGWDEEVPSCNGDPLNPSSSDLEYGLDVDTIVMNAENPPFDEHFRKGDDNMWLKIGANGDMVFTNILVLSVDTKAPKFDIPKNPNTPSGREKNYCSCALEEDAVCKDYPFWYSIKIQNWGTRLTTGVTFKDTLSPHVSYVSGTSEICRKFDENEMCQKWTAVEDASGGGFPFTEEYTVAEEMDKCDKETNICPDTVMVRFKVQPKSTIAKNTVIENMARINDEENRVYKTNTSVPLRLTIATEGNCPSKSECENPDMSRCGGNPDDLCETDEDCGENETCDTNTGDCVKDPDVFSDGASLSYSSAYTSGDDSRHIIIRSPEESLVAGRFTALATSDDPPSKKFTFEKIGVKFDYDDQKISFDSLKLYYDTDESGSLTDEDTLVAEDSTGLQSKYAEFVLNSDSNLFSVNTAHEFFVVVDVSYGSETVSSGAYFNTEIEGPAAFTAYDAAGEMEVTGDTLVFPTYEFEATDGVFVFSEDLVPVPSFEATSSTVMLTLRAISRGQSMTLSNISLRTVNDSVLFGKGINSATLFLDSNADGVYDQSSQMIANTGEIDKVANSQILRFDTPMELSADTEYHLLLVCSLDVSGDQYAQIMVDMVDISDTSVSIQGVPVYSLQFTADGDNGGGSSGGGDGTNTEDEGGCACSTVTSSGDPTGMILLLLLIAASVFVVRRGRSSV